MFSNGGTADTGTDVYKGMNEKSETNEQLLFKLIKKLKFSLKKKQLTNYIYYSSHGQVDFDGEWYSSTISTNETKRRNEDLPTKDVCFLNSERVHLLSCLR